MKSNIFPIITLVFLSVSICSLSYPSSVSADKDFCYDQVGDGHHCFEKVGNCRDVQKHDEIAESHCYKED